MDYYFSERGYEVCRIDGSVKLDERKRQVGVLFYIIMEYDFFFLIFLLALSQQLFLPGNFGCSRPFPVAS